MPADENADGQGEPVQSPGGPVSGLVSQDVGAFTQSSRSAVVAESPGEIFASMSLLVLACVIQVGWLGVLGCGVLWLFGAL
jgi:hypothetical protein